MDYGDQPVSKLWRGPVLHTPQGWVMLSASLLYVLLGILLLSTTIPELAPIQKLSISCFVIPFLLFVVFVKTNQPHFEPSLGRAAWGIVWAAMPLCVVLWKWWF